MDAMRKFWVKLECVEQGVKGLLQAEADRKAYYARKAAGDAGRTASVEGGAGKVVECKRCGAGGLEWRTSQKTGNRYLAPVDGKEPFHRCVGGPS